MFYKIEVIHILISVITISLAFALAFLESFPLILLTVGLGFVLHEIGHKFVAIKFGCTAIYRAWMEGLLLAVFFAIFTGGRFVFAAPGAVYIYKQGLTKKENGIIALAGPLVNVILAFLFFQLIRIRPLSVIGFFGFQVNLFLAMFNMVPIPPLDGSKVLGWNALIWAAVFIPLLLFTLGIFI